MEKNPMEQQNIKVNATKEEARLSFGRVFDDKLDVNKLVDYEIPKLDLLEKNGLLVNKEEIIKGLRESANIKERENFVNHLMKIYEPVLVFKANNQGIIDKAMRGYTKDENEGFRLSEVLYYELSEKTARIHLSPARDMTTRENIEKFKKDIEEGMQKLAEIIKPLGNIERVVATSWIMAVRGSRRRLEEMGFTVEGEITEEEKKEHFADEKRPVVSAFIPRGDFLAKYGKK